MTDLLLAGHAAQIGLLGRHLRERSHGHALPEQLGRPVSVLVSLHATA